MRNNKQRAAVLAIILGLVVLVMSACGSGQSVTGVSSSGSTPAPAATPAAVHSSSPQGPAQLKVGQHAIIGDNAGTEEATVSVDSVQVTQKPADLEFGEAPANGWYVIVHVTAAVDSNYHEGFDINTFDFNAVMNGGRVFSQGGGNSFEALNSAQENNDITATLAAGQSSSGYLAFDLPHPHGKIAYAPNFNGQPIAEWSY